MESRIIGYRAPDAVPLSSTTAWSHPKAKDSAERARCEDLEARVYDSYVEDREKKAPHRVHLGASDIGQGRKCLRKLFYVFRHAKSSKFGGRNIRLFERGDYEEAVVERDLKRIGIEVSTLAADGRQHSFTHELTGGHCRVNLDGIVTMPDGRKLALEIKTMSKKNFDALVKKGIKDSKPEYYSQMQWQLKIANLNDQNLDGALFWATCKDDDHIYIREVGIDEDEQAKLWEVASRVIGVVDIPLPLQIADSTPPCGYGKNPEYRCTFLDICKNGRKDLVEQSCRSCDHARPVANATWHCDIGRPFGTVCDQWALQKDL